MKLIDLEPSFLKIVDDSCNHRIDNIKDADGIVFLCPACYLKNKGPVGTHSIICWQPHIELKSYRTGPGRWKFLGSGYNDLTLQAGSNSIFLKNDCAAHFFITNGEITW